MAHASAGDEIVCSAAIYGGTLHLLQDMLARFGIAPQVRDGSGLSRSDRTSPREVVRLLAGMAGTQQGEAFDLVVRVNGIDLLPEDGVTIRITPGLPLMAPSPKKTT